jgi:hypothetical protein
MKGHAARYADPGRARSLSDVANACKKDLQTEGYVGQAAIPPRDVPRGGQSLFDYPQALRHVNKVYQRLSPHFLHHFGSLYLDSNLARSQFTCDLLV